MALDATSNFNQIVNQIMDATYVHNNEATSVGASAPPDDLK